MKIRKAEKRDFGQYLILRKQSTKEYSKLFNEKINISDISIKNEFDEFSSSKKRFLLIAEKDNEVKGYLVGSLILSDYQKIGYIDDVFILKRFRKKGAGKKLIERFLKILERNKIKKCRLGVSTKNNKAIDIYKKMGFKIKHYEMEKKLK